MSKKADEKKWRYRLKDYANAAHRAFKKGNYDKADKLWKKAEEALEKLRGLV